MSELSAQAVRILSTQIQKAANVAVESAAFVRMHRGTIIQMVAENTYRVAVNDQVLELSVYGSGFFKPMEQVVVVAPYNSKETSQMFILGSGSKDTSVEDQDHEILMQLVSDCANKLDKGVVVQEPGQSTTVIMSQKAVTDYVNDATSATIKGVLIGTAPVIPNEEGKITIPIAAESKLGVVCSASSDTPNGVTVTRDGIMEVTSLDVMRLYQEEDDTLILDCGDAAGI